MLVTPIGRLARVTQQGNLERLVVVVVVVAQCSVVSDSLRPHGLQHTRLLCTKFPEIPVSLERNPEVFRHPLL